MRGTTRKGFTLVELLVVIGIIAVLISILLPSLARARESALTIQCAANLRSIGQALTLYSDDNKGYFPVGWAAVTYDMNGDGTADTQDAYWYATLSTYMQGKMFTGSWSEDVNRSSAYFRCPSVTVVPIAPWVPVSNYGGHPIVFMTQFWLSSRNQNPATGQSRIEQYRSVWLQKNASEKALIWDTTVETAGGNIGWAFPGCGNVSGDQLWWGDYLIDAPGVWDTWVNVSTWPNEAIDLNGCFRDKPDNRCNDSGVFGSGEFTRFRHNNNTVCNILFGDGHVEGRQAIQTRDSATAKLPDRGKTDLLKRNFEVPWPVPNLHRP